MHYQWGRKWLWRIGGGSGITAMCLGHRPCCCTRCVTFILFEWYTETVQLLLLSLGKEYGNLIPCSEALVHLEKLPLNQFSTMSIQVEGCLDMKVGGSMGGPGEVLTSKWPDKLASFGSFDCLYEIYLIEWKHMRYKKKQNQLSINYLTLFRNFTTRLIF